MIKLFPFFGCFTLRSKQERDAIRSENERNHRAFVIGTDTTPAPLHHFTASPLTKPVINPARKGLGRPNRTGRES